MTFLSNFWADGLLMIVVRAVGYRTALTPSICPLQNDWQYGSIRPIFRVGISKSTLNYGEVPPSTAVSSFARILNNALQKLPRHVGAVYRGYESRRLSADFAKYPLGAVVEWPGFTSSTTDEDMAYDGNMLFTILSRTGRILGSYSDIPHELEVMFRTGTKFRVLRAEQVGSDVVIEMEELEEDTR